MQEADEALAWLQQGVRRHDILKVLSQPLTVKQISRKTGLSLSACSNVLWEVGVYQLVTCLNPERPKSHVYALTALGMLCQQQLWPDLPRHDFTLATPELYGWICFSHRSAVLKALDDQPRQGAAIRRRVRFSQPSIRMSANNCRDILKLFLQAGIVERVFVRKRVHPRYRLTLLGAELQTFILRGDTL